MGTVARLKDGDLMITGEINERLPAITNSLITHYPFDNSVNQDNLIDDTQEKTGIHPSSKVQWKLSQKVYAGQVYTVSGYFKRDSIHDGTIYCMFDLRRKDGTIATETNAISGWTSNEKDNEPLHYYFHDEIKYAVDDYVYWERDIIIPNDFNEGEFKWICFSWENGATSMIRPCLALKGHNVYTPILNQCTTLTQDGVSVECATENIIATSGTNLDVEYSGKDYPFMITDVTTKVLEKTPTGGIWTVSFEGKKGIGDGFPSLVVSFSDGSWEVHLDTTSSDWTRSSLTFDMPDPTGKQVHVAVYHMANGSSGISYARKMQLEDKPFATSFVDGIRSDNGVIEIPTNINPKQQSFSINYWISMNGDLDAGVRNAEKSISLNNFGSIWRPSPVSATRNVKVAWDYVTNTKARSSHTNETLFVEDVYEMITLTWDKSSVNIYRNGTLWGNAPSTADCTLGVIDKIGMYNVQGTVKNFSIYNRALTADEVKTLSIGRMSLDKNGSIITSKLVEDSRIPNVQMRDKDGLKIQGQLKEGVVF